MNAMVAELVAHKGYANAVMLGEIAKSPAAVADTELWELLHHILLANRFWLLASLGLPFEHKAESRVSSSFDELVQRYRLLYDDEATWHASATDADLSRVLAHPHIPGGSCAAWQAVLQVCLHSHGHRAQAAKLLRRHGGVMPQTDFILWLTERRTPEWPVGEHHDGAVTRPRHVARKARRSP